MKKGICLICNKEFEKRGSRQKTCGSDECRKAWQRFMYTQRSASLNSKCKTKKKKKDEMSALAKFNDAARKAHLSYGQYVLSVALATQ